MAKTYFERAYGLTTQDQIDDLYAAWAQSYDAEVGANGYATPRRCADALSLYLSPSLPVLDIGCGTGLSGAALRAAGFDTIDGTDPNPAMLVQAHKRGVYRHISQTDLADPYPFKPGLYAAISAIGVIGSGAAPVDVLFQSVNALAPGGLIVFSYNDHAMACAEFPAAVATLLAQGIAEQIFCEYGPHLPAKNVRSVVYVLRRR